MCLGTRATVHPPLVLQS
ncbi:hypothetical protein E2C01_088657 [Portunus trituberculatus]|uniref:Uncharacterized protein n=1 Tax=Portunus trituberculatus TaxID=210409 RepID=A0A5B7JG23_PORTR|nr:hypothetical protein [Portunus trituberculatus]